MTFTRIRFGAIAALTCAAAFGATGVATASPYLSVSQTAGVSPGQAVYVSLSGIEGIQGSVAIGQCKAQVSGPADCNLPGTLLGKADDAGNWTSNSGTAITLAASIGGVDCTAFEGACIVAVTALNNPSAMMATVPLSFG
ncbi:MULTISPECIES: neocarzinostatin apoprotein domain-containing protein [Nocardia]|uniref:neocarzinostatin apoprotein domain-containing protein n=1 Tax=Nocardia TaxID=1817 RepID=UPI00130090B3|nr:MULTISPECIES: neocarzinostatin apoprotein domain-containing protein [Nocardia]